MRRREFIAGLGGVATWSVVARAQQRAVPVIGFLHNGTSSAYNFVVAGFRQGLREAGYVEGQNIAVEYRWADNDLDRLATLVDDLVRQDVALIVAGGSPQPALAAKKATSTIPIVAVFAGDPVQFGLAASLNRPGGNVTGISLNDIEIAAKALGLLRDMVPQAGRIAILFESTLPSNVLEGLRQLVLVWEQALGREIIMLEARSERDFEPAFAALLANRAGALRVIPATLFTSNRAKLLALAARHKIPTAYPDRQFALDGGLMSYGASFAGAFRQIGVNIGRILEGDRPANLPFQLPTVYELVINLKTARTLGLEVPPTLLVVADEVIE
jgi:putative tryptophan/tyrosine transport system substrate-binding protein